MQERLNAPSISVTRHVQRIVSSHTVFSFSLSLLCTFIRIYSSSPIAAELERLDELYRVRSETVRQVDSDSSPSRLRLNWISSRSINGRMGTNSRCRQTVRFSQEKERERISRKYNSISIKVDYRFPLLYDVLLNKYILVKLP